MRARGVRKPEGRFDGVFLVPSGPSARQSYFFKFLQVSWNRKIRRFKCADDEWLVNSSSIFESRNQGFCGRNTTKWPRTGRLLTIPRLTNRLKERNRQEEQTTSKSRIESPRTAVSIDGKRAGHELLNAQDRRILCDNTESRTLMRSALA